MELATCSQPNIPIPAMEVCNEIVPAESCEILLSPLVGFFSRTSVYIYNILRGRIY
jgi:hypothetical protein